MNKITLALTSAATLALGAGVAFAQVPDRPDRDAEMTRADVAERTAAAFARMDANGDGILDASDREAMKAKRGERRAERQDARFERLDADSNGAISHAEFDAARDRFADRRGKRGEHGEGFGRRGHGKHDRAGFGGGRHMFGPGAFGADADGDKTVTQAEFTAAALERFDRADADGDGTVTAAERRAAMKAFREERRAARAETQS